MGELLSGMLSWNITSSTFSHCGTWRHDIYRQSSSSRIFSTTCMSDLISLTFINLTWLLWLEQMRTHFHLKRNISWWSTSSVSGPDWGERLLILLTRRGVLTSRLRLRWFSGGARGETVGWELMLGVTKRQRHTTRTFSPTPLAPV